MKNREKSLKHGYIFLSGIILTLFAVSLSTEIYLKGDFAFIEHSEEPQINELENEWKDDEELFLEIQNLTDGFKTTENIIAVVALTNTGNKSWINGVETDVNILGVLEDKVDLIIGENEIIVEVENEDGMKAIKRLTVIRKGKEKPKEEQQEPPQEVSAPVPVQLSIEDPFVPPLVVAQPEPKPNPIMGLKLQCSITNTQPFIGQTVILDCVVKDDDDKLINGATGNVTVNWQSGSENYSLSNSNDSGSMSLSFNVPEGNAGKVLGDVQVSNEGLAVTSEFSLEVQ